MQNIQPIKTLYETAFSDDERRDFYNLEHLAEKENKMRIKIEYLGGKLLGFIIYWTFENFIYVEHFAVNEQFRGKGCGTKIFRNFLKNCEKTVVLEVEPPETPTAEKRIRFYERLGMTTLRFQYAQPPYRPDKSPVNMLIMSSKNIKSKTDFEKIKTKIFEEIYLC